MSKKKKQSSAAGLYAMCITIGLIVGIGLGPVAGSVTVMALAGCAIGAGLAFALLRYADRVRGKHLH